MEAAVLITKIFTLHDVAFRYSGGDNLFENLNLDIFRGESLCLLGANGSGKSTLLKVLCGLVFPSGGHFYAFGQEITEAYLEDNQIAQKYHRQIGFIFQNPEAQLFNSQVWDEVAFGPRQLGLDEAEVKQRVEDVLGMLGLRDLADRSPYRLSGGEKKKVAVASTLVLNPEVLILDEPTNGLDPKTQRWLIELLLELNNRGRTIITATHNLELAHAISKRALVLSEDHCLVYDGSSQAALHDKALLMSVNLIDEYYHVHDAEEHQHYYFHG